MNTSRTAALLALPLALILGASVHAQGPGSGGGVKGDYSSKDSSAAGAGEAAPGGAEDLVLPFKAEGERGEIKSEIKCMGGKPGPGDSVSYPKCGHRSTDGFDEVAVKLKILSKDKLRKIDKKKLRRAKELAALKAAKKAIKKEIGEAKKKGKDISKKKILGKLEGAKERIESDLSQAVSRCKEKDSSDMDCDADFPPEEE